MAVHIKVTHYKGFDGNSGHRPDEWAVECAKFPGRFDAKSRYDATMRIASMRRSLSQHGIEDVEVEWTHGPGAHPDCKCHEGGVVVTGGDLAMRAMVERQS